MTDKLFENLLSYLSKRYGGAIVTDFKFLTSGFESDVYSFNLQLPSESPKDYILRLFNGEGADERIIRETNGLPLLKRSGILVPDLLLYEIEDQMLGKPFEIIEKLDGQALWPVLVKTDPAQVPLLLERFGKLLSQLHQVDWRSFTSQPDLYEKNPAILLDEIILSYRSVYTKHEVKSLMQIVKWLEAHKKEISVHPAVVHQDFHANNTFLSSDDRLFIIDWTQLAVSDYRMDLSWTLMIMGDFGKAEWAKQILDSYLASSIIKIEALDYFNVIACIKLLGSFITLFVSNAENPKIQKNLVQSMQKEIPIYKSLAQRMERVTGVHIQELDEMLSQEAIL